MSPIMITEKTSVHPLSENYNEIIEKITIKLFSHLIGNDEDGFIADFNKIKKKDLPRILPKTNGGETLLQLICRNEFDKAAVILLENEANLNFTPSERNLRPIELACYIGYSDVLKILLDKKCRTSYEPVNGSLIQIVINKEDKKLNGESKSNYKECLKILLEHQEIKRDINYLDCNENTALHYAAWSGDQDTILTLLKNGACIGIRNNMNVLAIAYICVKTLKTYLDDCLITNDQLPNHKDYELIFDYSFLKPSTSLTNHNNKLTVPVTVSEPLMDNSDVTISSNDCFLAPETDALLYMTQCSELKPLLKHPVITSFLYLKWQRIRFLFYANTFVYAMFYLSLILYIVLRYGGSAEKSEVAFLPRIFSIGFWILLFFREFYQIRLSSKEYFKSIENWSDMVLICITAAIVFNMTSDHINQQLSAIAILLSSADFFLLFGRFPYLATYSVMLKKVSLNFFKFLLFYSILIFAFSLSFYTLFGAVVTGELNGEKVAFDLNKMAGAHDDSPNFFLNPGISLFKTIVMTTGEFEAESIKFETFPITSHIIFVIFVFMIPIVLFNLLNGLAVSDTQTIKADAELVGHILRVKLVSHFESIFFGEGYKNALSRVNSFSRWLPGSNCIRLEIIFKRRICLFPNVLPTAQIGVKINQNCLVEVFTTDRYREQSVKADNPQRTLPQRNQIQMDGKIVKAAKKLITEREEGGSEMKQIQDKLLTCEKKTIKH